MPVWEGDLFVLTPCSLFGIPVECLPPIKSCSEHFGDLKISELAGVPLTGVDQGEAALVVTPPRASATSRARAWDSCASSLAWQRARQRCHMQ